MPSTRARRYARISDLVIRPKSAPIRSAQPQWLPWDCLGIRSFHNFSANTTNDSPSHDAASSRGDVFKPSSCRHFRCQASGKHRLAAVFSSSDNHGSIFVTLHNGAIVTISFARTNEADVALFLALERPPVASMVVDNQVIRAPINQFQTHPSSLPKTFRL